MKDYYDHDKSAEIVGNAIIAVGVILASLLAWFLWEVITYGLTLQVF